MSQKAVEYLRTATFMPALEAASILEAIEAMLGAVQNHPDVLDAAALREAVLERQMMDPPLLPSGVALPHARTGSVRSLVIAVATTAAPLPLDGTDVRIVVLIGVAKSATVAYLDLVAFITRKMREAGAVERLSRLREKDEFLSALAGS